MAPCSHNKTPSFIVVCPDRFFIFCCLVSSCFCLAQALFLPFCFLFLQEWKALTSNRENIIAKLPRVWKLRWHLLRHFSSDKSWKNQVMRFCSSFNSFVSMDANKSNSKPVRLLLYFSSRKRRPYAPKLTLQHYHSLWKDGGMADKNAEKFTLSEKFISSIFSPKIYLRFKLMMGFALD